MVEKTLNTGKRFRVLVTAPCFLPVLEKYRPRLEERGVEIIARENPERLEERDLLPLVKDIDGALCGDDCFTERVLRAAKKLKVISKWGTGIDSIDTATCERLKIAVRRSPGAFSDPVADTAMGMILCFARTILPTDKAMREGGWPKFPGRSLAESVIGIIGIGDIGRSVARRARAFGAPACPAGRRLLGYDVSPPPEPFLRETGLVMTTMEDLLRQSDFVTLHATLTPETRHIISAAELKLMKPSAVIINTARGPLIDESALIEALEKKRIAGAGLDVFEIEPLPLESPLRRMENVILGSHNANQSPTCMEAVHENTVRNLLEALEESEGVRYFHSITQP